MATMAQAKNIMNMFQLFLVEQGYVDSIDKVDQEAADIVGVLIAAIIYVAFSWVNYHYCTCWWALIFTPPKLRFWIVRGLVDTFDILINTQKFIFECLLRK